MSIRTVGRLARRALIAGLGGFAAGGSATFVPNSSSERISYQLAGARSIHSSRYTSFTYPRAGAMVAFAATAIACSAFIYTRGAGEEEKAKEQKAKEEEKAEEKAKEEGCCAPPTAADEFAQLRAGFRWDKFYEYMLGEDDELPEYVDWEEAGALAPPTNQLKCGSCVAITAVSSIESLHKIKTGKLVKFSAQQLVDCMGHGCSGCSPMAAYNYISKEGVTLEYDYPYTGIPGPCRSKDLPVAARINSYFLVYVGENERELMRAVAKQPVEVTIQATDSFVDFRGGYTLEPEHFDIKEDNWYEHSVLLVGYGVDENGPYWRIRNSWRPIWGDRGFAKLRRGVKDPNGTGGITRPGSFAFFPVMD